jgi:hypothetical protein
MMEAVKFGAIVWNSTAVAAFHHSDGRICGLS